MNKLLNQQLDELLTTSTSQANLKCEGALRVGAATLCRALPTEITATTVLCLTGGADADAFRSVVQDIADEFGLDATIRQQQEQQASCSVRFTRPLLPIVTPNAGTSLLARLLRR